MGESKTWHKSPRGADLWELLSALQKDIRRGNIKQAMAWALELSINHGDQLGKRLLIIANEDVGLGGEGNEHLSDNLALLTYIHTTIPQMKIWIKKDVGSYRLILANVIIGLCRAVKSRDADELQLSVRGDLITEGLPEMPDYALDKHTRRGKKMGRGFKQFLEEGAKLQNEGKVAPYREKASMYWLQSDAAEIDLDSWDKPEDETQTSLGF